MVGRQVKRPGLTYAEICVCVCVCVCVTDNIEGPETEEVCIDIHRNTCVCVCNR